MVDKWKELFSVGHIPLETDDNPKEKLLLVSNHYKNTLDNSLKVYCDENDHF